MSFFYLTPVKGELPIHLLEIIINNRLEHLKTVFGGAPETYNEYVIEGSVYDNVGHFTLCIMVILCVNREFSQFFMKAELEQFKRRLAALSAYEMRSFSKKLLRTIKKYENVPTHVQSLEVLCQHLMLKEVAQHVCSTCVNNCTVHKISVNFKSCLPLVARRQVELRNGIAEIPCSRWKQYLVMLFSQNLKNRLNNTGFETLKSDPRIMGLLAEIRNNYTLVEDKTNVLKSKDVDKTSLYFPPCMLNLHQSLRKKHRLSHSQRFYYSLFLKDIGMPVEEAIEFWRAEYRLHPNGSHSCCHTWEKDEKKFLYGIRHMYGLEGCRKNYTSVNCQRIQSTDNACSEGGCPFKSFDSSKMAPLLQGCTEPVMSKINELKSKNMYTSACMMYMQSCHVESTGCDNSSFNFTPVKYYMTASKNIVN
ncbi:DNA primase large subunit-like [Anticarsia gemmatalis]|uniref:DNA primase large subunit-like n=1 Tax=Anticarsia gemmatalis TaxID=129554 RepID=UPI003F75B20D